MDWKLLRDREVPGDVVTGDEGALVRFRHSQWRIARHESDDKSDSRGRFSVVLGPVDGPKVVQREFAWTQDVGPMLRLVRDPRALLVEGQAVFVFDLRWQRLAVALRRAAVGISSAPSTVAVQSGDDWLFASGKQLKVARSSTTSRSDHVSPSPRKAPFSFTDSTADKTTVLNK